jgi:uncharacterized membrane protein
MHFISPNMATRKTVFEWLLIILALFQIQDAVCTYIGVSSYGFWIEQNPLILSAMQTFGIFWGLAIPKLISLSLIYTVYEITKRMAYKKSTLFLVFLVDFFYAWAAYNWFCLLFRV